MLALSHLLRPQGYRHLSRRFSVLFIFPLHHPGSVAPRSVVEDVKPSERTNRSDKVDSRGYPGIRRIRRCWNSLCLDGIPRGDGGLLPPMVLSPQYIVPGCGKPHRGARSL